MPIAYQTVGGVKKLLTKDGHLCNTCCCSPYVLRAIEVSAGYDPVYFPDLFVNQGVVTGGGKYWRAAIWMYFFSAWEIKGAAIVNPLDGSLGWIADTGLDYSVYFNSPEWTFYSGMVTNQGATRLEFQISCDGVTWPS